MNSFGRILAIPLITVLFIFLCLLAFVKFAGPLPFSVNSISTTKDSLFTVDGKGEVTAVPDTAMLSLGVTKNASTVQSAQDQVNSIINKVTDDLKSLGVDSKDIKTTDYNVNPEYDYNTGDQKLNGYTVDASLEVKVSPIDKANKAIDIATKDGATDVGGVQFVVADDKQKELMNQARKQAIDDAKSKAEVLSRDSGLRLGRIVDVQENPQYNPVPMMAGAMPKTADSVVQPATQLNPGQNKITVDVILSYETY